MAGETVITVVGNLTADPELKFTQLGVALASFTIASTPRTFDKQANEWKDGEGLFLRSTAWKDDAEHVAATLAKGMRVIARGTLKQRSYEHEGQKRTSYELDVDEIGPSLKYATAQVTRAQRSQQAQGGSNGSFAGGNSSGPANGAQAGGWAPDASGSFDDSEAPF